MKGWWLRLMRYASPQWRHLLLVAFLMLIGVVVEVLKPWPLKLIVDSVLGHQALPASISWIATLPGGTSSSALLGWLSAAVILLFLAAQAINLARDYLQTGARSRMVYALGAELFTHLQRLSLRFHGQQHVGDLMRRVISDSRCAGELVMDVLLPVLMSLLTLVMMFTVMWHLDSFLTLVMVLGAPVLAVLIKIFSGLITEREYQHEQLEGSMMALAEQTLTALPVVQAFGREACEDERFRKLSERTVGAYVDVTRSELQFRVGTSTVTSLSTAVVMLLGGMHVLEGTLSIGNLLIFLAYVGGLCGPMETLAHVSSGFAAAAARARRVLEVLDAQWEVRDRPGARPLRGGVCGHVRLEGVSFGYEPGRAVLQEVTLEVHPGETVALVGPTGAGKSTLVSLIPRFFDPWSGRVTLDGVDVREVQLSSLRGQVAVVLQEPFLLPLTVAENIAYGRPGASQEAIEAVAVAANADRFIRCLPQGYATVIGERGATLSGGEKQRLAIARALLKDAPVLILDEPTSALDTQTEALVLEALERLMRGRTTFIIAHRLSTVRRADRIVVLEQGRVIEMGTHEGLMAKEGRYMHLLARQFEKECSPRV
jgi:ATP-binding cassette, subfamily B, bacterial